MCGILGAVSSEIQHNAEFHKFLSCLFTNSQVRGRDASGFAAVVDSQFLTDKIDESAYSFVKRSKDWRSLIGASKMSMIAHTRAATAGNPRDNKNNHPFHGPRYSIVHNGGISGYKTIAQDKGFKLETGCDSELILHYLESHDNIRDAIIECLSELTVCASMAVAVLEHETSKIHIFREISGPCYIVRFNKWNAIAFASSQSILAESALDVLRSRPAVEKHSTLLFDGIVPGFAHITITPGGGVQVDNLKEQVKMLSKYDRQSRKNLDSRVFSGGVSKFERKRLTVRKTTNEIKCMFCENDIDVETIVSHPGKYETPAGFICDDCAKTPSHDIDESSARLIMPSDLSSTQSGNYVMSLYTLVSKIRPVAEELSEDESLIYESIRETERDFMLGMWTGTDMAAVADMSDGEYKAYIDFCRDVIDYDD